MADARSPHPVLDEHLKTMPMALAAQWEMTLHCRCGVCRHSRSAYIKSILHERPSLERYRVSDVADRLRCGNCASPYLTVWLSDTSYAPNCPGVYPPTWGVVVTDRRDRARAKGLPDGSTEVPDEYAPQYTKMLF